MPVPFQYLEKFSFLRPLPQEALMRLSQQAEVRQFARREIVHDKNHPVLSLGFLLDGRLQGVDFTVDGRAVGLYFIEPGEFFGELSVVDGAPPAEHLIAAAKSSAIFVDETTSRQLIFETPALAKAVMTRLSSRIRDITAQRTLLALPNPFQRLCAQLLLLGRSDSNSERRNIEPAPTHQELAIMINSSRETVTRAFQLLILQQAIVRDGDSLRLMRVNYLREISEGRTDPPKA